MRWMHQYVANRNVFGDCLKLFPPIIGFRKLSGREFQTDGPATQKARRLQELSWWRGTTRSCWVADRRCCCDATPATGWHNSTRYGGTWPCRHLNTMTPSLYTTHTVLSNVMELLMRGDVSADVSLDVLLLLLLLLYSFTGYFIKTNDNDDDEQQVDMWPR